MERFAYEIFTENEEKKTTLERETYFSPNTQKHAT